LNRNSNNTNPSIGTNVDIHIYLDQATASISAWALRYNSSLFARALRRSIIAGSSFSKEDSRLVCEKDLCKPSTLKFI